MLVRPFGAEQFINANILEQVHQVAKAVRSSFRASLDYASAFQQFSDGKFDELSNASKAIEKKLSQEKQNRNSDEELDQWLALISRGKKRWWEEQMRRKDKGWARIRQEVVAKFLKGRDQWKGKKRD